MIEALEAILVLVGFARPLLGLRLYVQSLSEEAEPTLGI